MVRTRKPWSAIFHVQDDAGVLCKDPLELGELVILGHELD